jgi:hypothetical protein
VQREAMMAYTGAGHAIRTIIALNFLLAYIMRTREMPRVVQKTALVVPSVVKLKEMATGTCKERKIYVKTKIIQE